MPDRGSFAFTFGQAHVPRHLAGQVKRGPAVAFLERKQGDQCPKSGKSYPGAPRRGIKRHHGHWGTYMVGVSDNQFSLSDPPGQKQLLDRSCAKKSQISMPRYLPPLNAIRAFEAAGRHGSFTGAADELNVSHSAISRHVRGLEKHLGTSLFRSQSRGLELTEEGQRYLKALTPALDRISTASETLRGEAEGKVTVNSDPMFAERWLVPRLPEFEAAYPKVAINLIASDRLARLDQHEADLALRFHQHGYDGSDADLLSNLPVYPYAVPTIANTLNTPVDFLSHPLLVEREGDPWREWFCLAGLVESDIPKVPRKFNAVLSLAAALAGQGIILINPELVDIDERQGRMVRCSDIGLKSGSMHVVYADGARRKRAVRVFSRWLLEESRPWRETEGEGALFN